MTGLNTPARDLTEQLARIEGRLTELEKLRDFVRVPFANLLTNGTFDSATGWTLGTGWSIGSGVASHAATGSGSLTSSGEAPVIGRRYLTGFALTRSAGSVNTTTGGVTSGLFTATGAVTFALTAQSTAHTLVFGSTDFVGSIDNLYRWEADPTDNAPWLRLPEGLKVGNRGHVFRDGNKLFAADYTEEEIAGQYFIKPLVAPGVSTRFEVYCGRAD